MVETQKLCPILKEKCTESECLSYSVRPGSYRGIDRSDDGTEVECTVSSLTVPYCDLLQKTLV